MMQASTVVWKFPDLIGLNSPNPSVMHLGLLFALAIAQPGAAASNDMVTAMRRDTVHLPCHCPKSITVLVVYWQKVPYDTSRNFEEVKLKTLAGQEVTAHLDPRFASRAELDPQNVDLILRTVGVEDAGKYECIVSQRGPDTYLMKLHDFSVQLAVTANFSVPEITRVPAGTMQKGTTVNFTCSSNEGYPEPVRLDWIISSINGTIQGELQTHQDNDTKLYSLTSPLTWLFTETINISCVIQQKADPQQVYSDIISVGLEKEVDEPRNRFLLKAFAAICVPIVIFATAILVKCLKKRTADCPDGDAARRTGEMPQIWIVGDSIVKWEGKEAEKGTCGTQLGCSYNVALVRWLDLRGR